jgi:hypothetical protein
MPTYAYPSRTQILDEATVATLADNLSETAIPQGYRNALLMQLMLRKNKEPGLQIQGTNLKLPSIQVKTKTQGGSRAEQFVDFESGNTAQSFSGNQILETSVGDGATVTWVDWAFYTCYVGLPFTTKAKNTGPQKRLDILTQIQNREIRGLIRDMETDLWSTNADTAEGSQNDFAGVQHKIKLDPTSSTVVQGLNQSTFTPWRNQYTTTMGSFATNGLDVMRAMWFTLSGVNGMEPPHLITTNSTIAGYTIKALEGVHRIVGSLDGADLSASKLPTFMGVPIVHTDDSPASLMHWWNFDYLVNLIHEQANWSDYIPGMPNDQLVVDQKRYVFGAAPMMLLRREKFGVIGGITA